MHPNRPTNRDGSSSWKGGDTNMQKDRLSLFWLMSLVMLGAYWTIYFATVGPDGASYHVFSRFTPPAYRVPSVFQAVAHSMFEPAFFLESRFLRPAKWDAFRPPPVLQTPAEGQSK